MLHLHHMSSSPSAQLTPIVPRPPRHHPRFRQLFFTLMLLFTLSVNILGGWTTSTALAFAFTFAHSTKPTLTFQQFLKHAQQAPPPQPFVFPRKTPPIPFTPKSKPKASATAPSAEPPTMKPLSATLTPAFLTGTPNAAPLDLVGSDHRLEVQLAPGSFDLAHAVNAQGKPFHGVLVLTITQIHGHFATSLSLLGRYQFALTDTHGHPVTGIRLRTPITFLYHYQLWEMSHLGLDPGHLLFSWPGLIATARHHATPHGAPDPIANNVIALTDDPRAQTLTAHSTVFDLGPFDVGGGQINQGPPSPHLASTEGNSGQFAYSYPIQLPPGPAGFSPQLALSYSSSDPNERHSTT